MELLIILLILLLVFGGGGFYTTRRRRATVIAPGDSVGFDFGNILYVLAAIVLIVIVLRLLGVV